ncbi:alkaline phosphatase D family protein [Hoyosella sp. YIM 151337]|uniref:alkaline phosphatase D family protein n=1 Tax=Hoyosella sp. YIM 151337 TaxID=2992742 RepID=UPI002236296C|nr:alkaline phosphatase D family protein [Hoyosella sp. YIM 151337]MCW4353231.1 alkaline phosphatase D family protein [Hoyosella sp. YIM 151337]
MVISRRALLRSAAALSGASAVAVTYPHGAFAQPGPVFRHGVASGDPLPDRVVIWTRITPVPEAAPGSGIGPPVSVRWELARDPAFTQVAAQGTVTTGPERDHTVKVDVSGLAPANRYFYRFHAGGELGGTSDTGTTRTAPAPGTPVPRLRFAVVSCSNWEAGYFSAYRHLADRGDLDAVIHLGDYLYEYGVGEYGGKHGSVRAHQPSHDIVTLADYRIRHAQYKTDPDLQRLHREVPWIPIWDDHESANDSWRGGAENHDPATQGDWATRYRSALQAYLEWLPVRPAGDRLYRRLQFGDLCELSMIDLRSYRDETPGVAEWPAVDAPGRTIAGADQLSWLVTGLTTSPARWQLVGNPVMIAPLVVPPLEPDTTAAITEMLGIPRGGIPINTDQWDGYTADRRRVIEAITANGPASVVFLTGDIHSTWANELPINPANYPAGGTAAVEFVVPSVTSKNIDDILQVPERTVSPAAEGAIRQVNQHVRDVELDSHGYGVCEVTPEQVQMDWYYVSHVADPGASVRHALSRRTRHGSAVVEPAVVLDPAAYQPGRP